MHKAFHNIQLDLQKSFDSLQKSKYNDPGTYSGSWPTHVTKDQAENHVRAHGSESDGGERHWGDFLHEVGDKPMYHKDKVLGWLGY